MSLVRHVNRLQRPVLCLQQNRQSQIQSQAWRDSLNHLEGRQGWPPSSLRVHFHVAPRFRNFRGSTRVSTWGKGSRSFRHARWRTTKPPTPLPIPRPIMSQRRVVLTQAVGDFCPLIPFRLLVVDDVVVWIVLSAFFASPPFLLFSFFLPSTPLSMASLATTNRVLGRGFLFFYSLWNRRVDDAIVSTGGGRRMSRMMASL